MLRCPNCYRATDLFTVEQVTGHAPLEVADDGREIFYGHTKMLWDSSVTTGYGCDWCGWSGGKGELKRPTKETDHVSMDVQ